MPLYAPSLSSLDIHDRPVGCKTCPYGSTGSGFVPTWCPPKPRVAFLAEAAGSTEIGDKQPLTGGTGRFFMYLVERLGYTRADCLLANVLGCMPLSLKYPIGQLRKDAESYCRRYDGLHGIGLEPGGLLSFNADCFIISIHPAAVLRSNQMTPLLQHDVAGEFGGTIAKAFRLAAAGRRPLVLLGDKAKDLVAPEFAEGVTKWVGHVEELGVGELGRRLAAVPLRDNISSWWKVVREEKV